MRKTIMLGTLIALSGAGALAQARDVTATEQSPVEASQPAAAVRGEETGREHRAASSAQHRANRDGRRKHHDEASRRHDDNQEHGRRHH